MADVITRFKVDSAEYERKIGKAKKELDGFGKVGKGAKDVLGQLDKAIGTNVSGLLKMGSALGAAGLAFGAMNKAIHSSQSTADEYGRVMESATSVVDNFFASITSGSFDSFVSGLKDVIQNARDAYDALDTLGTFNIYNTKKTSEFDKRRAELRANIRKGVDVEDSKKALQSLEQEEMKYYQQQAKVNRKTANARLEKYTGAGADVLAPYLTDVSGQSRALEEAARLEKMKTSKNQITRINYYTQNIDKKVAALKRFGELADDKLQDVMTDFANANRAETTMYNMQASDQRLLNLGNNKRGSGGGRGGRGGNTPAPIDWTFKVKVIGEDEESQMLLDDMTKKGPGSGMEMFAKMGLGDMEKSIFGTDRNEATYDEFTQQRTEWMKQKDKEDAERMNEMVDTLKAAPAQLLGGLNGLNDGLKGLGINFGNGIDDVLGKFNAVITIISSIEAIVTTIQGIQTIGTFLGFFSGGGIARAANGLVPGRSMSGDKLPVLVNSGEIIMNRAQQNAIASQLQGGGFGSMNLSATISGEDIRLALNNNSRRRGRGEYVTSR